MKAFSNYDSAKKAAEATALPKLPAGAYICKILAVKFENGENGYSDRIAIQFDIAEGDYKDFFKKNYEANTAEDKKWKGSTRIYVPTDDGSEKDGWTKNTFAKWTTAFEKSNNGYSWDWDENKWKGLKVGIVFGETGTVIDGKQIVYTESRFPVATDSVSDGTAPVAKFKAKNGYTGNPDDNGAGTAGDGFFNIPAGTDEEIPF